MIYYLKFIECGISDIPSPKVKVEMVSNVITVEFVCPDHPNQPRGIKRKLLKDMEVQKVIGLAQRLFRTGGKIPRLSFIQQNVIITFYNLYMYIGVYLSEITSLRYRVLFTWKKSFKDTLLGEGRRSSAGYLPITVAAVECDRIASGTHIVHLNVFT